MAQERHLAISIDDLHPRNDSFTQAYKVIGKEQDVIAIVYLDVVERGHFLRGRYLPNAYELSSTYENVTHRALTSRQDAIGTEMIHTLEVRMLAAMQEAGWCIVAKTREGWDIWQHRPSRHIAAGKSEQATQRPTTARTMTVIRMAREVTFVCAICSKQVIQERMPSPLPRYCSPITKTQT